MQPRKTTIYGALAVAGAIGLSAGAAPVAAVGEPIVLPKMSVAATKTSREVFSTPASVSVVNAEEIGLVNPADYVDLLQAVPGVVVQGGSRRIAETPVIRGFSDQQVVIRTDGARRNFNQAHRGRFPVDPDLVGRVEVLRGPGSGLYGSGAMGGVVDITTKSALDFLDGDGTGAKVGLGYRSNGGEASGTLAGFGVSGGFDILGSAVLRDRSEDLEDGDGADILATEDEVESYFGKIGYAPSDSQRFELTVDDYTNNGINPPNTNDTVTPGAALVDRDTARRSLRARWTDARPDNDAVDLDAVFYVNEAESVESRLDARRIDRTTYDTTGFEVKNTATLAGSGARVTYGLDYYRDEQTGDRDGAARPQFPDAEMAVLAGFVQGEFDFAGGFSLIPSVRYDSFDLEPTGAFADRDESEISPSLGVGFNVDDEHFFWAKAARAFRAPSLTELYADGVHFVAPIGPGEVVVNEFVPTPDLEPEESTSFELGYRRQTDGVWQAGDRMTFSATVFHNDVNNYVDQRVVFISGPPAFDPRTRSLVFPGITTNESVDAVLEGIEIELDYTSVTWFGRLSASLLDSEINGSDMGLASAPADKFVATIGRRIGGDTRVGARLTWAASQDDVPEGTVGTDSYTLLDLFSNHGFDNGMRVAFGVSNVLDETYSIHPTTIHQPGRSFNLTISKQF
ncbi:MAG: TonB-dependent receptor [Gammaproteobacteria bacterium]|nr:TonB-dependent receptor [Gammaproteobacteria bacterium]